MKFCPNCGVKLDNDNFKFCPECGYKFGSDTNNNSNAKKSGGLVSSFIKRVRDEIPDEYVDKIKDNETIDDAVTHAKIIWHGPQTEKEKAYKERKRQEKERKKQEYREIREQYKKKVEIQEDEKLDNKVDDDIKQGLKTCPHCGKQIPHNAIRCKYCKTMLKTYSDNKPLETSNKETKKETQNSEISAKQELYEPDYSNLDLSDLQESLIKSLPIITNPSEYEDNIIKKYAEFNSEERKELLNDCWTVTKLAEEHNINRQEVQKAILTDEFLEKDLICVFKVNPNNVRSLKILYRKPLIEKQKTENPVTDEEFIEEVEEISKEQTEEEIVEQPHTIEEEPIKTEKQSVEEIVDGETEVQQEVSIDKPVVTNEHVEEKVESTQTVNTSIKATQNNKKIYKKTKTQGKKRGLFSKKSPELKNLEKELTYYLGGMKDSDYYNKRIEELNGSRAPNGNVRTILIDEFENGNLSMDNLTTRIDELIDLDNLSLIKYMLREGYDTSVIKTQNDLYEFLKEKYDDFTADKSNFKIKLHKSGMWGFAAYNKYNPILMKEFEEGNLSLDNLETRIGELRELDIDAMKGKVFDKGHDTSVIKTQDDLYEFLKENYGMQVAEDSNKKRYRKEEIFKKYDIDPNETYCFECIIEERRSSTFTNTDRRNVDHAYVALYDDHIVIIKESVWLKSDMGMRKVYFNNVTSIDYDTAGKLGMSSSLFIHVHSGEHVQLKNITKERVDEVHKKFENFTNNKNNSNNNNVTITQETSNADELLKYAELYKQGLLSEEEFEAKKKELL